MAEFTQSWVGTLTVAVGAGQVSASIVGTIQAAGNFGVLGTAIVAGSITVATLRGPVIVGSITTPPIAILGDNAANPAVIPFVGGGPAPATGCWHVRALATLAAEFLAIGGVLHAPDAWSMPQGSIIGAVAYKYTIPVAFGVNPGAVTNGTIISGLIAVG